MLQEALRCTLTTGLDPMPVTRVRVLEQLLLTCYQVWSSKHCMAPCGSSSVVVEDVTLAALALALASLWACSDASVLAM